MNRKIKAFICLITILAFAAGCSSQKAVDTNTEMFAQLIVSKNYCDEILSDKKVKVYKDDKIRDLLSRNLKVETQYNGGFVKSINKLSSANISGKYYDWFYYVNGVASNSSFKSFKVSNNDKIFWDYHLWADNTFTPAVIGAYPEPFIQGFKGQTQKVIIYPAGNAKPESKRLALSLQNKGAKNIEIKDIELNSIAKRNNPTIVIGTWEELAKNTDIKKICARNIKSGIFASFAVDKFVLLNSKGEEIESYTKNTAVISATGTGLGDANPLWIITALDQAALAKAINVLDKTPEKIKGFYGAAIVNGEIKKLPVTTNNNLKQSNELNNNMQKNTSEKPVQSEVYNKNQPARLKQINPSDLQTNTTKLQTNDTALNTKTSTGEDFNLEASFSHINTPTIQTKASISRTVDYLHSYYSNKISAGLVDWPIISLISAGENPRSTKWFEIIKTSIGLREKEIINEIDFDSNRATDYHRLILSVLAVGKNPKNFADRNFINPVKKTQLSNGKFADTVSSGGNNLINAHIWGIIALYSAGEDIPNKNKAYKWLTDNQNSDGGFGITINSNKSDIDMTGMALLAFGALDKTYKDKHVEKALNFISSQQLENGGFQTWGIENPESAAAVVQGLVAVGINPASTRWIKKDGQNPITFITSFQLEDGSFSHTFKGESDLIATYKALMALSDFYNNKSVFRCLREETQSSN